MARSQTVDEYVGRLPPEQREIVARLRALVLRTSPGATEAIKWAQPVFEASGPFCYIKAHARHVTFGFWRGMDLVHLSDRIEGSGAKMGHIRLRALGEVDEALFAKIVRAAVALNKKHGSPSLGR